MAEHADIVVNTKVTPEAFARINATCKKLGISPDDLLNMLADFIITNLNFRNNF